MQLHGVLDLLRAHSALPLSREEAAAVRDTIAFAGAHPDCLLRSCAPGHLTGSAWVVCPDRRRTLLTHHRKLGKWLQLGGHADGEADLLAVAMREAREESGLARIVAVDTRLFDVDRHWIPERKGEPGHWHHDLRFMLVADPSEPLTVTDESRALAWVEVAGVFALNPEESMMRMVRKTMEARL
ncbi:MAG TPA: NUDIX hydrolase [Opitutaceae bacterium]|nr:NUDIX hydrolase [Opitutaceae bacterium]